MVGKSGLSNNIFHFFSTFEYITVEIPIKFYYFSEKKLFTMDLHFHFSGFFKESVNLLCIFPPLGQDFGYG